jgi:hypothetical protein
MQNKIRMGTTGYERCNIMVWTKCSCTELIKNLISIIPEWARGHPQSTLTPSECTCPNAFSIVENSVTCPAKLGLQKPHCFTFDVLYIPKMFTPHNRFHFREQKKSHRGLNWANRKGNLW